MKVCHILAGYYPGYAAPYEHTRKLAELGIDVDVVCIRRPEEMAEQVVDGVSVHRIMESAKFHASSLSSARFLDRARRYLKTHQYDIGHVYAFRGCGLLPILNPRTASTWIMDIRTGSTSSKARIANYVTKLESHTFDKILVLDELVGRHVLGSKQDFDVLPLGTDFSHFVPGKNLLYREQHGVKRDEILLVFLGRFNNPLRTPEQILQGFALAAQQCPKLKLMLIGDGILLPQLQLLAQELNVQSQVIFAGEISFLEVVNYLQMADIGMAYVPMIPQFDPQPPLKTVEFLACGLPTIATATRGNRHFIEDGTNGLLVNDDPVALSQGIIRLVNEPHLRQHFAEVARDSVKQYDWQQIISQQLLPIYKETLNG